MMDAPYHTVLKMALPVADPYACHKVIAWYFSPSREDERDYQFVAGETDVYVRASSPRILDAAWKRMDLPRAGAAGILTSTIWFDATRFNADGMRTRWRQPSAMREWLRERLRPVGDVDIASLDYLPGRPLNKPGVPQGVVMTPVRYLARVRIRDEDAVARLLRDGMGRGRAFGFGCVLFQEDRHV